MTAFPPTVTPLAVLPDKSFCLGFPYWTDAKVLVASTAQTLTVPAGANHVFFSSNIDFYSIATPTGKTAVVATVPGISTTDGSACEMNPIGRYCGNVATISLISASSGIVTASFYG